MYYEFFGLSKPPFDLTPDTVRSRVHDARFQDGQ